MNRMGNVSDVQADHVCFFHCLGEVTSKDNRLGNSFLKRDIIKVLFDVNSSDYVTSPLVKLFGRKFSYDCPLLLYEQDVFTICQKNYLAIYKSALKTDSRIFDATVFKTQNINCGHLRREICEFMNFIHNYLTILWINNSPEITNQVLLQCSENLSSFWHSLKNVPNLPDYIVYSGCAVENKFLPAAFHFMHLHLDLQCYKLAVLCRLEQLVFHDELGNVLLDIDEEVNLYTQSLVQDLFILAISRFEKLPSNEIRRKSPFPCTCFKEMYILIQIFLERYKKTSPKNEFWTLVNNLCLKLLLPSTSDAQLNVNGNKISCSNPVLFSLWITVHLGHLYCYSEKGEYIGSSCDRMVSNNALLNHILKLLVTGDTISEAQLRSCIPFIMELIVDLWPPQRETIFKLWEYFHQHVNSCFFLLGSAADSVAINCTTGAEILQQAKYIVDPSGNSGLHPENSYNLFLRLLVSFLQKYPLQWSSIKGRIFSKFSRAKMLSLKEMGIFNFALLFLCMALTEHTKEIGNKMQVLLNQATSVSLNLKQRLMIWKAHLALFQLYVEKDMDIGEASRVLMKDVNQKSSCKNIDGIALFKIFATGLRDIIMTSKTLNYSEHKLIGCWINSYLKLAKEPAFLLDTLSEIMSKILSLSKSIGMIEYNASESHLTKMYLAIYKHLLPYIKEKFAISDPTNSYTQIADLAVNITLLALNRTNVGVSGTSVPHLFECFAVNANPVNAELSIRYVCVLLQEEGIRSELMDTYHNCEILIIQTWIRCSVFSIKNDSQKDLLKLTEIVCKIPCFVALCREANVDIRTQSKPVDSFINVLGHLFSKRNSLEERSTFREQCLLYLTPMVKSFERILRDKYENERILCRIYELSAILIQECGPIIYSKSQPFCIFNSLVSSLLLQMEFFKPGVQIPQPMLCAIQRTFPMFVKGIMKLNIVSQNSLSPIIKNLVIRYFPRLMGKSFVNSQECGKISALNKHPFLLCFEHEDDEVPKMVLEIISQSFLRVGDSQCMNALMFLLEILREKRFDDAMVKLFIDKSLACVLEVVILADRSLLIMRRQAVHLLKEILNNKINSNITLRENFWSILWTVIQRHIILHTVNVMSLLCKMCEIAPNMMMDRLQQIKDMVTSPSIFYRTNVVKTVRLGVENMEKLLSLPKQ